MSVILRGGGADTHASASPGAVDYVLDEVKADSTAVAVFDGAASAALSANSTRVGAGAAATASGTAVGRSANASDGGVALGASASAGAAGVAILGTADAGAIAIRGTTSGGNAIALGQSSAAALACVSIGVASNTTGGNSVALGTWARATGVQSMALGGGNSNTGADQGPNATGDYAIAIGVGALAPNNYDITIGHGADATGGSSSIAIGRSADATAANAIALGHTAVASAAGAIAIGQNATASAADTITIGASYLTGGMDTAKHLSPAAASGVALGTTALYYSSLFVDAAFPRTRATDYFRVFITPPAGNMGTNANAFVTFPGAAGATIVGAGAASSQFSLATSGNSCGVLRTSAAAFAVTALVTFEVRVVAIKGVGDTARGSVQIATGTNADLATGYNMVGADSPHDFVNAQTNPNTTLTVTRLVTFPASTATYVVPRWFGNVTAGGSNGIWTAVATHVVQFTVQAL